jgi:hypothetical protein
VSEWRECERELSMVVGEGGGCEGFPSRPLGDGGFPQHTAAAAAEEEEEEECAVAGRDFGFGAMRSSHHVALMCTPTEMFGVVVGVLM